MSDRAADKTIIATGDLAMDWSLARTLVYTRFVELDRRRDKHLLAAWW
jgi:hypothetical protein